LAYDYGVIFSADSEEEEEITSFQPHQPDEKLHQPDVAGMM